MSLHTCLLPARPLGCRSRLLGFSCVRCVVTCCRCLHLLCGKRAVVSFCTGFRFPGDTASEGELSNVLRFLLFGNFFLIILLLHHAFGNEAMCLCARQQDMLVDPGPCGFGRFAPSPLAQACRSWVRSLTVLPASSVTAFMLSLVSGGTDSDMAHCTLVPDFPGSWPRFLSFPIPDFLESIIVSSKFRTFLKP